MLDEVLYILLTEAFVIPPGGGFWKRTSHDEARTLRIRD
jgi:hypothetical protein